MVKAVELYLEDDHEGLNKEWQRRLEFISSQVTKVPSVTTTYPPMEIANHVPHLRINWDAKKIHLTPGEVAKALRNGTPSIILDTGDRGDMLYMNSFMLKPGEEKVVATELTKVLRAHLAS